jgi:acetyl esterase
MPLDPQAEFLLNRAAEADNPDLCTLSPIAARAMLDQPPEPGGLDPQLDEITDRSIPGPGGELTIRIYRPVGAGDQSPALLFFHGGGWVLGTLDGYDLVCGAICEATDATVVSVDYRLAPESPFPAAPDDCTAATRWVAENGAEIGVDGTRLAVCGDSAGGNLAGAVVQDCIDGPIINAQVLMYPATDMTGFDRTSYKAFGEGFLLTMASMTWFVDHYAPTQSMREDPRASPLLGKLAGQPPALVFTAGFDPLHDEGKEYADALASAGVHVEYHCYPGQVHSFFRDAGLMDASRDAVSRIAAFLKPRL